MSRPLPETGRAPAHLLPLTDRGNAQRLIHHFGDRLRWVEPWSRWLHYDGKRWAKDETLQVMRYAKAAALAICEEAAPRTEAESLLKWARGSESRHRLDAMVGLARSEPGVAVSPDELDADPWFLNTQNGIVDLETGKLFPHAPESLLTKITEAEFDPKATSERWESFLDTLTGGDAALATFLQRAVGASLSGAENEKALFIVIGPGDTGKTTFLRAVMHALGDYAVQAERNLLLQRSHEAHPTGLADLAGRRMATCTEVNKTQHFDAALLKQLTGKDRVRARRMREDFWEFDPTHTIWLACNDMPGFDPTDEALWRRLRIIPFTNRVAAHEQEPNLAERLQEDRDAILAWAVRGCLEWQAEGLAEPEAMSSAREAYRKQVDPIYRFVQEECEPARGHEVGATELHEIYTAFAKAHGAPACSQKSFGSRLTDLGITRSRGSSGRITYTGIRPVKDLKDLQVSLPEA